MKIYYFLFFIFCLNACKESGDKNNSVAQISQDSTTIAQYFEKASKNRDSSNFYVTSAKELVAKNGSQRCQITFLFLAGKKQLMASKLDSVTSIADSGLRIKYLPENKSLKGKFFNLKANVAGFERKVYQSLEYYTAAEKLFVEAKDSNSMAGIYSNITNAYFSLKDYATGLQYAAKAFQLLRCVKEDRIKTNILSTYALALTKNKQFSVALKMQLKADSISNITKDVMAKMAVAIGYAEIYKSTKQFELAKNNYDKCIALSKTTGVKHFELMSNIGLLSLYEELDETNKIIEKADSTIKLAIQLNNTDVLYTTKRIIGRALAKNNDYKNGFLNLNESYALYDSTAGIENQKNINELRVKYKVEQSETAVLKQSVQLLKQKEELQKSKIILIALAMGLSALVGLFFVRRSFTKEKSKRLELENHKRVQSAIISGEEKERKRLAFEIHDGIASMITGITYKLATENFEKTEVVSLLNNLQEDSRKIAHNLMPIDFEKLNLLDSLQNLCSQLTTKEVDIVLMTKELKLALSLQKSHLMYRTIQELINNALKHSQCKSIFVKIEKDHGNVNFSVEDDGIGVPQNILENGFKSIRERISVLEGKLIVNSNQSDGTTVKIKISND